MALDNRKLNILFLDDVDGYVDLALEEIQRAGLTCDHICMDELRDFRKKFFDFLPHIVVSKYKMSKCNVLDALSLVKEINIPFVVIIDELDEKLIDETRQEGATKFVLREHLSHLPINIERALNEKEIGKSRKNVEHVLVHSKERLELALEGTNMGVWDLDFMSDSIVYNPRSLSILGLGPDDAIKEFNYFQQDNDLEVSSMVMAMDAHIEGRTPLFEKEFPMYNSVNKTTNWVQVRGKVIRRSVEGEPLRASGTLLDITEKKINEERLKKNQMILENAESVAQIGSFEWVAKGSRFLMSEGFGKIFDIEKNDDLSVFSIFKIRMHGQDKPFLKELFLSKKEFYDIEHRIVMPDDSVKLLRNTGNINLNTKGKISSVMGIVQDITEQRDISKSIFKAQEYERTRIARDIHDGIGQMLVAAKFKLSSLEPEQIPAMESKKEEIEDMLATTLEEIRRVSRNLSNRYLEDFGLKKTLEYLVDEISNMGLNVSHDFDVPVGYDMEVSNTIYRIAQEATSNVIKYAKASNLLITVETTDQNIILEVKDDGVGFDGAEINWNGIKNMKERASLQNGHFEISSKVGKGTSVKSWFPLTV
ncbi:MAG: histidine kinase [Reichenbachiella sp.]